MVKQRKKQVKLLLLALSLLFLSACGTEKKENTQPEADRAGAAFYAENTDGSYVNAFLSESDGVWYLAIPSSWDLAELKVHFSGEVTETEKGELDQRTSSISGAFEKSGDRTVLKNKDGAAQTLAVLQSDLPSVQIDLNSVTLEEVHADKSQKHRGNTVLITDPDGNVAVESLNNTELKGRGNSTWQRYEKKSYQLKFTEEKDVLGMGQADKWVLLANASDDSMVRTQVVYDAAKQLDMAFVPDFVYVDLWIDGGYLGTYMIGEKVDLVESRLNLKDPLGVLVERDDAFYKEESHWIYNDYLEAYFVVKETVANDDKLVPTLLKDVSSKVDRLMTYLYETPSSYITLEELSEYIDVDSFATYYLVNEYVQNRESTATSFFWYTDGTQDVLHLGPVWDFDTCIGNDGADYSEYYCYESIVYKYLLAVPEFYQRTQQLYQDNKHVFDSMADRAVVLGEQIRESAEANYLRWNVLGSESIKPNGAPFAESYSEALTNVKDWLAGRAKLFEVPKTKVVASVVSDDYGSLNFRYVDDEGYESLRFVCWNRSSDSGKVVWYDGVKTDGEWTASADLTFFREKGMYQISVYAPGNDIALATGANYVPNVKKGEHTVETVLSDDTKQLSVTITDPWRRCDEVYFVIWSTESNQADMQVFHAERELLGDWTSTVDLSGYKGEGEYNIHVFGRKEDGESRICADTFIRYPIWDPSENPYLIETQLSEDSSSVTVTLTVPKDDCSVVNFLVWSSDGGQSDLQVCPAERIEPGVWRYTVDLTQYEIDGEYNVHAFGNKPYAYIKLNTAEFYVDFSHR